MSRRGPPVNPEDKLLTEKTELKRLRDELSVLTAENVELAEKYAAEKAAHKKSGSAQPVGFSLVAALYASLCANRDTHARQISKRSTGAAMPIVTKLHTLDCSFINEIRASFHDMIPALDASEALRAEKLELLQERKGVVVCFNDEIRAEYSSLKSEGRRNDFVEAWKEANPEWVKLVASAETAEAIKRQKKEHPTEEQQCLTNLDMAASVQGMIDNAPHDAMDILVQINKED